MPANPTLRNITPDATVRQILEADEQAEELLASIGFSPRSHEAETLRAACRQKHWDEEEVLRWLKKNHVSNGEGERPSPPGEDGDLGDWCPYMAKAYLDRNSELLAEIEKVFPRVRKIHGNQYLWLKQVSWHLEKLEDKLDWYMYFQRRKWFPLLGKLDASRRSPQYGTIKKIENSLELMEGDQQALLDLARDVENSSRGFHNPPGACSTFRILNHHLEQLCRSVRKQVTVEREHFFPRVKQQLS